MSIHHQSILTLARPARERLALRRTVLRGGYGSKVAVLAGIHGNELEGLTSATAWLECLMATRPRAFLGQSAFKSIFPVACDRICPLRQRAPGQGLGRRGSATVSAGHTPQDEVW